MTLSEKASTRDSYAVLHNRQFLACPQCGWVHYLMTAEEKAASDRLIERYHFNETERFIYESAFRQCLRCESPANEFRLAEEHDLDRAAGHLVTSVFIETAGSLH